MKDPNENRPGYKKIKVGWVPDEWIYDLLKSTGSVLTGTTPSTLHPEYYGGKYPFVTPVDMGVSPWIKNSVSKLTSNGFKKARKVCKGAVLFVCIGSTIGKVGIANVELATNQQINTIIPNSNNIGTFLYYALLYHSRRIASYAGCQAVPIINKSQFESVRLPLPPLFEQKKIAEILSTWDEAIEQTRNLIDAKNRRKKALMQQLLTGKKRFRNSGGNNWCIRPFGELIEPVLRPVPKPKQPYLSIGIRSHGKGTFQKTVEQPEKVMMETLYQLDHQDIVVNITFAWEGAIAIATEKDKGGLVSHRFPTYRFKEKEADIDFFRNLFLTKRFIWDLGLISPGGAGRNRVMNKKDFLKLKIFSPPVEIQKEIGKILSTAENEIKALENYKNILEIQKRGLMQKLLTGEVRVKL